MKASADDLRPSSSPGGEEGAAELRASEIHRFAWILAAIAVSVALLPTLIGFATAPPGGFYLGHQYNVDDHMVYAAWMRQAAEGRFLFDNRFAVDPQPGLTLHLFFLALGWVSALTGPAVAAMLARVVFGALFVVLLGRLLVKTELSTFAAKLALFVATMGAGIGFMVWVDFGIAVPASAPQFLKDALMGSASIDVWQPEVFVFPSLLTNALFCASLCLILWVLIAALEARDSWKPVLGGAVAYGLLMNIHSYDVLLLAMVMVGFLVAAVVQRQMTAIWLGRLVVIGLGALPAALWFLWVLQNDPVFQARAATETFAPHFRLVLFGLLPGLVGAGLAAVLAFAGDRKRQALAAIPVVLLILALTLTARNEPGYQLDWALWGLAFVGALVAVGCVSRPDPAWNLLWSWALVGLVAPYFPMLFQRKLAMAMMVPWAILAAAGVGLALVGRERMPRNLATALVCIVLGGTSLYWVQREMRLLRDNVSNTTVHRVIYSADVARIVDRLNQEKDRSVILAMPGVARPLEGGGFAEPYITDLNTVLTGLTGVYSYSGHWSETPDYLTRRGEATQFFMRGVSDAQRAEILEQSGATHLVAPNPRTFGDLPLEDVSRFGDVVYRGTQFSLIRVRP